MAKCAAALLNVAFCSPTDPVSVHALVATFFWKGAVRTSNLDIGRRLKPIGQSHYGCLDNVSQNSKLQTTQDAFQHKEKGLGVLGRMFMANFRALAETSTES
jgi:hypothetical protein